MDEPAKTEGKDEKYDALIVRNDAVIFEVAYFYDDNGTRRDGRLRWDKFNDPEKGSFRQSTPTKSGSWFLWPVPGQDWYMGGIDEGKGWQLLTLAPDRPPAHRVGSQRGSCKLIFYNPPAPEAAGYDRRVHLQEVAGKIETNSAAVFKLTYYIGDEVHMVWNRLDEPEKGRWRRDYDHGGKRQLRGFWYLVDDASSRNFGWIGQMIDESNRRYLIRVLRNP